MGRILVDEAFRMFLNEQKIRGNSSSTSVYYSDCFDAFDFYLHSFVDEYTSDDIRQWLLYCRSSPLSSVSVATYFRGVRAMFKFWYKRGFIDSDIFADIKTPKSHARMIRILTDLEIERLNYVLPFGSRDMLIVELMLSAGLRLSEVARLCVDDVRIGYIFVNGKGGQERVVPLSPEYCQMLIDLARANARQSVFGMTPNAIRLMFQRLKRRADIPRLHAHLLRHTFATRYILLGGDSLMLKSILGHSTLSMTQHYVHLANMYKIAGYA